MRASILPSYGLELSFIVFPGADHSYTVFSNFPHSLRVNVVYVRRINTRTFLPVL